MGWYKRLGVRRSVVFMICLLVCFFVGQVLGASQANDRAAPLQFLTGKTNQLLIQGEGLGAMPEFTLVFSRSALDLQSGQLPRLVPGQGLAQAVAFTVKGKATNKDGFWEYNFGLGADAQAPWNAGPDFSVSQWALCDDAIWSHLAIVLPLGSSGKINQVILTRSNVVLYNSTATRTLVTKQAVQFSLPQVQPALAASDRAILNLGPAMAQFRSSYYEIAPVPALIEAYSHLGQTAAASFTLRGKQWCSEFVAATFRAFNWDMPNPDLYDVNWRNLKDWFKLRGTVYELSEVLRWSDEQKRQRIPPGSYVSLVLSSDGSTHSFIFNDWSSETGLNSFSGLSGNNLATVWPHSKVSLLDRLPADHPEYAQRAFFGVFPSTNPNQATAPARPMQPQWLWTDRLAADGTAAFWRAQGESTVSQALGPALGLSMLQVVQALVASSQDNYQKAKNIHDWITRYIAYDSDLLVRLSQSGDPDGGNDAVSTFQYRRSNCAGLAALYVAMAQAAGLEARVITGYIKSGANANNSLVSHAWVRLEIDQQPYLVDCSADSRVFWNRGKSSAIAAYEQRSDHFLIKPEAKAVAYLANKPQDKLLAKPIALQDFRSAPRFTIAYATYGLEYLGSEGGVFSEARSTNGRSGFTLVDQCEIASQILKLQFSAPADTWLDASLTDLQGKIQNGFTLVEKTGSLFICQIAVPAKGRWKVVINARSLAQSQRVNQVWAFDLVANNPVSLGPMRIQASYMAPQLGINLRNCFIDHMAGEMIFDLDCPADVRLIVGQTDALGKYLPGASRLLETATGYRFFATIPPRGAWGINISGKSATDNSGKGNQRIFTCFFGQ